LPTEPDPTPYHHLPRTGRVARLAERLASLGKTQTEAEALIERAAVGLNLPRQGTDEHEAILAQYADPKDVTHGIHVPLGFVPDVLVNRKTCWIPIASEEPCVISATRSGALRISTDGGFHVTPFRQAILTGQVALFEIPDPAAAKAAVEREQQALRDLADAAAPGFKRRLGGTRRIHLRATRDPGIHVVEIDIDCIDAMGATKVTQATEALAPRLAELTGGRAATCILTNDAPDRLVHVQCHVRESSLDPDRGRADAIAQGIVDAARFAAADPRRAATHNKGIMNGLSGVVVATGNDTRAAEAAAHAFAASLDRGYGPLSRWTRAGGWIEGSLGVPVVLGTAGGATRINPTAQLAMALAGEPDGKRLAMLAAVAGMACHFTAMRFLAVRGIGERHGAGQARAMALSNPDLKR
jgi:hydroxymethylglutaryl-CoA reductase